MNISGKFEVKLNPVDSTLSGEDDFIYARMSIQKNFFGDLDASSTGEMLSVRTPVPGSAGYVALETVKGHLSRKEGSFVLQHFGSMHQGDQFLVLEVVPDSGTGDLVGISGKMDIRIEDGQHFYDFEYDLPT